MADQSVNLKMLAERLGLSQTTVSRALNGFPEVAETTRQRVIEAAAAMNYRPSLSAASLATGKSWTIGHIVPLAEHRMMNPHFTDFISGAGETYASHDYEMLIKVIPAADEARAYSELAARKRVDGVVVHGPLSEDPRIELLQRLGIPFVVHGRSDGEKHDYAWLDVNNRSAFRRATRLLIDLGHERIALLNGLEAMNFAKRRREGYEAAMRDAGLQIDKRLIASADMVEPYGHDTADRLLKSEDPPTAFIASSILVALGIARAINKAGLRIGQDVSVIAFDDCLSFLQPEGPSAQPPYFTSMQSSIRDAGKRVAQMLIDQINNRDEPFAQELWEAQLVLGSTTGPANPRTRRPASNRHTSPTSSH